MDVSTTELEQGLRLLQSGLTLGPRRSDGDGKLYAYLGEDGETACMFLTGQGGNCVKAADAPRLQGVLPQVMPGYPGQTPAAVALVADSVTSVDLMINAETTSVPIVNNSIYADLKSLQAGETIELRATYADGSVWVYPLFNSKGETRTAEMLMPRAG